MASRPGIWYSIPEWYGIRQEIDGTLLPVTTAYDARNMETGDGNLSVAKGFTKNISTAVPGSEKILKLIVPQGSQSTYVVTVEHIYAWVYENNEWSWKTIWTWSPALSAAQVDALQTRIGTTDTVLISTGSSQMVKISTATDTAANFGAGLYSYNGTVTAFDANTATMTVSPALDSEAVRRAIAYGVIYGDGIYADVYSINEAGDEITLEAALVSPPTANDPITVRGGGSDAWVGYTELYSNRLFAAGDPSAPYRLYWSAVPGDGRTIEDWLSVDGSIDASGGYVEVGDGSADPIIGLTAISNQLLIWKRYSVWRLYGDRPSNYTLERIDKSSDIMSNSGVIVKYDAPYLLMPSGIHTYNNVSVVPVDGGVKPLRRFFDGKPDVSNSRGAYWDNRMYMTCKTTTTSTTGYDNAIIVLDLARNSYMIRDGFEIADLTAVGSQIYLINGSRYVYEFEQGTSYDGAPIAAYWLTQPTDFGKKMNRHQAMALYAHVTGDPAKVTVIGDYLTPSKTLTPLTARAGYTMLHFQTDRQYFIQYKFENIDGGAFTFHGGVNLYAISEMEG
jgi:hypothetical protein